MKRKDIEKEAKDRCTSEHMEEWNKDFGISCFIDGAEWRINSVWHKEIQNGKTRKAILVKFKNRLFNVFEDIRDLKGIEDKVEAFAYIEDLIPNTEEIE